MKLVAPSVPVVGEIDKCGLTAAFTAGAINTVPIASNTVKTVRPETMRIVIRKSRSVGDNLVLNFV